MKALIIADEAKAQRLRIHAFCPEDEVLVASTPPGLQDSLSGTSVQVVLLDLDMAGKAASALLGELVRSHAELPVVALHGAAMSAADQDRLTSKGVRALLRRPFTPDALRDTLRMHALVKPATAANDAPPHAHADAEAGVREVFSEDPVMQRTLEIARRAAASQATILILGESGTGKTMLARMIHHESPLASHPLVTVNCPCLSSELLESELFGHVRGAFTGAVQDTWGKVAAAEGGTLFLDEVGDLPGELQAKLLRLLQEKEYERLGEARPRRANVRIIAATNHDLKAAVAAGHFREDLYYRLNVIALTVPPLRDRPLDIGRAAEAFLAQICHQLGRPLLQLEDGVRQLLLNHSWRGNLRELRNVLERAVVLCEGSTLREDDFGELLGDDQAPQVQLGDQICLREVEEAHIREVISRSPSLDYAARILGIDKSTLYRKRLRMQPEVSLFPVDPERQEQH